MTIKNKMYNLKRIMKILSIIISILAMPLLVYEVALHYVFNGALVFFVFITFGLILAVIMLPLANIFLMFKAPSSVTGKVFYSITTFSVWFYTTLVAAAPNRIYTDEGGVNSVATNDTLRWLTVILSLLVFIISIERLIDLKSLVVKIFKLPIKLKNLPTKLISSPIAPRRAMLIELLLIAIPFLIVVMGSLWYSFTSNQVGDYVAFRFGIITFAMETLFELVITLPLALVFVKYRFVKAVGMILYTILQSLVIVALYGTYVPMLHRAGADDMIVGIARLGVTFTDLLVVTWIATYGLIIIFLLANRSKQ